MDPREHLRALVASLPAGSAVTVPIAWIAALLTDQAGSGADTAAVAPADLTVHDLAMRFGRKPPTIRMWLEAGQFPTAYKFQGREWRVPLDGVAAFEARERQRAEAPQVDPAADAPVNLSTWRRHLAS